MDICIFDTLHTNSRCVFSMMDLSEIKDIPWIFFNPLPHDNFWNNLQMKQSADDNFKFDENSRKFFKLVENTVSKGEIACYKQFLLFPQCFQEVCFQGASKGVVVWEWVKQSLVGFCQSYEIFPYSWIWFCYSNIRPILEYLSIRSHP